MLLNILLSADSSDQPYFLIREGFPTLFEHVGMPNMKPVKDTVSKYPEDFLVTHIKLL